MRGEQAGDERHHDEQKQHPEADQQRRRLVAYPPGGAQQRNRRPSNGFWLTCVVFGFRHHALRSRGSTSWYRLNRPSATART